MASFSSSSSLARAFVRNNPSKHSTAARRMACRPAMLLAPDNLRIGASFRPAASSPAGSCRMASSIRRLGVDANPNMSSAVVHNGILTTMGVIDTTGEGVVEQTKNILATIDGLLAEGGTDRSKLLSASIWLKDISGDFAAFNEVWVKWIDAEHKPVRACVESNLAFPNLVVEIQVTAVVVE